MSKLFFGPIKNPTRKDFFIRVGGSALIFIAAISLAKAFFPGYESTAVYIVAGAIFTITTIQSIRYNKARKIKGPRNKKKRLSKKAKRQRK